MMIRRALELILIAAVVVGGVSAWRTGRDRAALGAEFARLAKAAGDLEILDPAKVHVLALDTGEPMHYAWRFYLPANYNFQVRSNGGGGISGSSAQPLEFIARVRLREDPGTGAIRIFESHNGGSSLTGLGDNTFAARFREHGGRFVAERLGSAGVAVVDPKDSAVLLRLSFAGESRPDAKEDSPAEFYRLEFGPKKPSPPAGGGTP